MTNSNRVQSANSEDGGLGIAAVLTLGLAAVGIGYELGSAAAGDPVEPALLVAFCAAAIPTVAYLVSRRRA